MSHHCTILGQWQGHIFTAHLHQVGHLQSFGRPLRPINMPPMQLIGRTYKFQINIIFHLQPGAPPPRSQARRREGRSTLRGTCQNIQNMFDSEFNFLYQQIFVIMSIFLTKKWKRTVPQRSTTPSYIYVYVPCTDIDDL